MNNSIKIKYKKYDNYELKKQGYINLNGKVINNNRDIVDVCDIFRNYQYETFRIFYIKDNKIVANEFLTSKLPNKVVITDRKHEKEWYIKINDRIKRLKADGYYIAHNHTTNSSIPSIEDLCFSMDMVENVNGFLGNIIVGCENSYSFIEKNKKGIMKKSEEFFIDNGKYIKFKKELDENSIYDVKITDVEPLVYVLKHLMDDKDYSTTIFIDNKNKIRMVMDIPNKMFNQTEENLNGFLKKIALSCGAIRILVGTQDQKTYDILDKHCEYGTFAEAVFFDGDEYVSNFSLSLRNLYGERTSGMVTCKVKERQ